MRSEDFNSCEIEATLFEDLINSNLMYAHLVCVIVCLFREIYETNVKLSG